MEFTVLDHTLYYQKEDVAYVNFPAVSDGVVEITIVFVDPSLRGRGVAGQLMEQLVQVLTQRNLKAIATCPYAAQWFRRHPEQQHLLA